MAEKANERLAIVIGDAALDFEPGPEREAFIEARCHGDPQLAQTVRIYIAGLKQVLRSDLLSSVAGPVALKRVHKLPVKVLQGRYRLGALLGRGGMGKVFQAVDMNTGQPVAIKFIASTFAFNQERRMRLVREAHAAVGLKHPHIVATRDIGQVKGNLYIVMDYVPGTSLMHRIPQLSGSLASVLSIVAQVAEALGYAHSQGVVHGDVKPENIMIMPEGRAKLVDFGLARQIGLPTLAAGRNGTYPYMSPEQLEMHGTDARSDIWSTGVTLFVALTGKYPFRNTNEITTAPVPSLTQLFPMGSELDKVLSRALAKKPDMRYPKADCLAEDLQSLILRYEAAYRSSVSQDFFVRSLPTAGLRLPVSIPDPETANRAKLHERNIDPHRPLPIDSEVMESVYVLPDLGFTKPLGGDLVSAVRTFSWHRGPLTRKRASNSAVAKFAGAAPSIGIYFYAVLSAVAVVAYHLGRVLDRTIPFFLILIGAAIALSVIAALVWWSAVNIAASFRSVLSRLEDRPQCNKCGLRMKQTGIWTRFAGDKTQIRFSQEDCWAALKSGLWEDATKLLDIHGIAGVCDYVHQLLSPARFHLSYFECKFCCDHAARLTSYDQIGGTWNRNAKYYQVYWGMNPAPRPLPQWMKVVLRTWLERALAVLEHHVWLLQKSRL